MPETQTMLILEDGRTVGLMYGGTLEDICRELGLPEKTLAQARVFSGNVARLDGDVLRSHLPAGAEPFAGPVPDWYLQGLADACPTCKAPAREPCDVSRGVMHKARLPRHMGETSHPRLVT